MSRWVRFAATCLLGLLMILVVALLVPGHPALADDQPNGSILVSPQTVNGTWGPGTITAASNVVINAGVVITVAPGTTIVFSGNYTLTVNGELRVNGPATFTHSLATPGSWGGIVYAPGSSGYMDGATIEYAQRGLTLNTVNPIVVSNSVIRYNRHTVSGAGIYIQSGNHRITGTLIYNNEVAGTGIVYGGGVFIENNSSQLLNSRIYNNTVTSTGNKGGGGGVMIRRSSGTVAPLIEGCEVTTNTLRTAGGSSLANGAGIGIEGTTGAVIRNNWIADNQSVPTAGYGGGGGIGFEQDARAALIDRNIIANNLSMGPGHSEGGGIDCWGGNVVTVTNNLLYNNRSRTIGGGMNINANAGAGLNVNVLNNTVVSNTSASGGGLYVQSNGVVLNNLVVGNLATTRGGGIHRDSGTVDYNDVWGNRSPTNPDIYGTVGVNNLSVNPLFLNLGDLAQQYHLQPCSPVVDAGTNTGARLPAGDYDGQPRPQLTTWDIGFDEVAAGPYVCKSAAPTGYVAPGQVITYTLRFGNAGVATTANVVITDVLPAGLTDAAYVSSGASVTPIPGPTYAWQVQDLAQGETGIITITARVDISLFGQTIRNVVELTSDQGGNAAGSSTSVCSTIQCMIDVSNPGETIIVPAGIYTETLTLSKPVSVTGVSSATVIVRAPANQRVLLVNNASVTNDVLIANMTFQNGNTTASGGGVYITGGAQPRFEDMIFTNNTARYRGGAIFMDSPGGTLIVRRSRFTGNQANYNNDANTRGAAIAVSGAGSRLIVEETTLSNNTSERYGGAVAIEGNVTPAYLSITDSLLSGNTASEVDGGAIFGNLAIITITHSTLDNNRAPSGDRLGGAVYLTGVGSRLTLIGSTLSNNLGFRQGGAIYANGNDIQINVLEGSALTGNSTADNDTYAYGGAIYLFGNRAALTISASTVSTNTSVNYGGAIFMDGNSDTDQARLTITDSRVNNNEATLYNGGGIWADQTLVSITNSTVDGNRAATAARVGGGIYLTGLNTALTLDHSSVSHNLVGRTGAGIYASGNYIQMVVRNGSVIDSNESTEDNDAAQGGGIYLYGVGVRLNVADSSISNNIAERFGGGVYFYNNSNTIPGQLTVSRSQVNANEATDRSGGGLYVYQTTVTITQSTLNNNRAPDTSGDWAGGALYMAGAGSNLTLTDSTVTGNTVAAYGGGIYLSNTTAQVIIANSVISGNITLRSVTANTGGGGLYLSAAGASRLTISDSVFANNRSQRAGGALLYYGATTSVLSVTDSQFTGNQAVTNNGGGLYVRQAATTLTRVTVSGNTANGAGGDGGGLYLEGSGAASTFDQIEVTNNTANDLGGGIYAGSTLTLRNATLRGNTTNNRGGGLYAAGGTLTINDSTLAQNATYLAADGDGGAIYTAVNATLNNTQIISNTANDDGGGIYGSAGTVTLNDSTLAGNVAAATADADGGALYVNGNTTLTRVTLRGNTANRYGGGIYRANGNITLDRSTLAENIAGNSGGALYMAGGTLTTANSTLSGNRSGGDGGALWVNTNANLYNTTIFNNTAVGLGGGVRRASAGAIVFRNSLVAGNSPANCSGSIATTGVSNLADDATCGSNFGNNSNAARLGPLADNGGPTWTHLLLPGNPALNTGNAATCAASPVNGIDQRGVARPQGAQCDIGAVETTATLALAKTSVNEGGDPLRPGERITYTLILVNESPLDNTGVVITDTVPAHTTYIPGSLTIQPPSAGGTPGVQPVLVNNLTVAADSVVTVTLVVLADRPLDTGDLIINTASARSDQVTSPVSAVVSDTVVATPQVRVVKQGPAMANVGSTAVYTFSVSNAGDTRLHNLTVWDDLTGAVTYLGGDDGNGWLDLNEIWVYAATYAILPTAPNLITNTVTVTASDAAGLVVTDSDTHTLDVAYNPLLALTKSGLAKANVGETVTFTFTVAHAAASDGSPVSAVSVTDDIAGPATYMSGDDGDGLLESGETWLWTAAYTLQATDPDPLVNTATVGGLDLEGEAITATATHSLDINFAPVAADDTAVTDEDTAVSIAVLTNDSDSDADTLTIVAVETTGLLGNVVNHGVNVTYDPGLAFQHLAAGQTATETFGYVVSDGVLTATAHVTVTINGLNDAPIALDDTAVTDEDTAVSIAVLANDSDPDDSTALTVTAIDTTGLLGSVTNNGSDVTYDPGLAFQHLAAGQTATETFGYVVSDGVLTATAHVTVTINGLNDAPIALDDAAVTDEDTAISIAVLANDSDPDDGAALTITAIDTTGLLGSVTNNGSDVTYDPGLAFQHLAAGQTATETFGYVVSDGVLTATARVTVTITGLNDDLTALDDLAATDQDTAISIDVLANDSDPDDGDALTITAIDTTGLLGSVVNHGVNVTYDPGLAFQHLAVGQTAVETFGYVVSDGVFTATARVTVTINGLNDAPIVQDDTAITDENVTISIDVLANDSDPDDGDILTIHMVGAAVYGTAILNGDQIIYTPTSGLTGDDVLTYTVRDDNGGFSTATVTVTVLPVYHSLTVNVTGGGYVTRLPDTSDYRHNTIVTLTAVPDPHWAFERWSDDLGGTDNPATLVMDGDKTVTAVFVYQGYRPLIQVSKDGPDTAQVGQTIVYTFTISHASGSDGSPVSDMDVQDNVAGAATLMDGDDGDGLLIGGETWIYTAAYTVQESDLGDLVNTVTAQGRDHDGGLVMAQDSHTTHVEQGAPKTFLVFLPIVSKSVVGPAPDLVIESITATPNGVTIVIKNQGNAAVQDSFWVDLYVAPQPIPDGVNQIWNDGRSEQGAVWGVEGAALPIQPGETRTLTIGDEYYHANLSRLNWPLAVGTPIYVQVDSANALTDYGAVWERHEIAGETYNNIGVSVVAAGGSTQSPLVLQAHPPLDEALPPR